MNTQISAVLDELSARFGATGAELWQELVRYQVWHAAVVATAFWLVELILFFVFGVFAYCLYKDKGDEELNTTGAIVSIVLGGFTFIFTVASTVDAVSAFIAPQAATLRGLLN